MRKKGNQKGKNGSLLKRRLQVRFVLLAAIALVLLQSAIVTFSIARSYQQMTLKADRMIKMTSTSPDAPELGEARYFCVTYSLTDKSMKVDLSCISTVTRQQAAEYARQVLDAHTDRGYVGNFRYLVRRKKDGITITFLSRMVAIQAFRSNSETLILFSGAGMLLMTVLLAVVSGKVVEPLVRNRQKQKEFITSASHELKTPLTVILADAQLLESEIDENEWLTDIIRQTHHLTEMTQRLVYLARIEEQEDRMVHIEFPISDVAEEIAESYRAVASGSNKRFEVEIQSDISYEGEEKGIREMMTVLLDNAFKYSASGGEVLVNLTAEGRGVRFRVENTVENIDPRQLEHFGERFYRADTSDKVKGFGIGLSIACAVAKAHKGKLTAELPDPHCIRFTVTLK